MTHQEGGIQSDLRINKISDGKCRNFSFLTPERDGCVLLSFYTHHSQLYRGKAARREDTSQRQRRETLATFSSEGVAQLQTRGGEGAGAGD